MSAQIKVVPKAKRLHVSARYEHETLQFQGDIFSFLEHLMKERLTGVGTFRLNIGSAYGLEFDVRQLVPAEDSEIAIDREAIPTVLTVPTVK